MPAELQVIRDPRAAASALSPPAALLAAFLGIAVAILAGIAGLRWMRCVTPEGAPAIGNPVPCAGDAEPGGDDPHRPSAEIA